MASENEALQKPKNLDQVYLSIKSYGLYQLFFFLTVQCAAWPSASNNVAGFFSLGGLIPDYICSDEGLQFHLTPDVIRKNSTKACDLVRSCRNLTTQNSWFSMYEEYEWVCQPEYIRSTISSILPVVSFIAYTVSGHISDHFGRRLLVIIGFACTIFCGYAKALTPSWEFYLGLTVLSSLIGTLYVSASFSLMVESVHSKYRMIQGFAFQWSIGYMLAGLSCYLTGNWRHHLLLMNTIGIPSLILMFLIQESPRFLIQRGRYKQAAAVLNWIAWFNRVRCPVFSVEDMEAIHLESSKESHSTPTRKYTFLHLFSNWRLATYAITQIVTGLSMNIIGSVMFFNIQDLSGHPFMNIALMGALRLWIPFAAIALEMKYVRFGRKKLFLFSQGVVFLCFTAMFIIDALELGSSYRATGTGLVLLGYVTETGLVWIVYKLYTTELFPTVIRTIALSTFSCTSLMGSALGPQLIFLKKYWHSAPYLGASVSAGLAVLLGLIFLPETKFAQLPDTIHQAKQRRKSIDGNLKETTTLDARPLVQRDEETKERLLR